MENVIFKYSDFFKDDGGFDKVRQRFDKLGDELIKKAKEVREKTKIVDLNNIDQFNQLEKETEELVATNKKYEESLKRISALEKSLATARGKTVKGITKETEALKKSRAEQRQIAKIQNTTVGTIENLRAKLALVTTAWTKLTAEEIKNTARGKRLNESKKQLTVTLRKLESATKDNRRFVGGYSEAIGKLRGGFISLTSAMGVSLGLFGAFRLLKSSVSIIRDYEKVNATLAGVLNTTTDQTQDLQEQSKALGATTVQTASEVVKLQLAYARLGFTQEEILDLTAPTIDGSIALNAGLEETSLLVGAIVNSYDDLSSTDAPKIIETLSASTTKSALSFEKLAVGLPIVLGAANALNVPLEEITATMGKLADSGIETSTGATSLRNIFIESAKRGINYKDALKQITQSQDKLTTANKLFGKRAAVSALVIANNTEGVAELTKELESAEVVMQLVDNELNTLDGSLKLLKSAWEGMILNLNDSTDGGNALARTLRFVGENLQTIFKVIAISTTAWIAYNIALRATTALTKANIVWTKGQTIVQNLQTIATNASTVAQRAFNTAVKANPIGLLIALLATAVTAYLFFRDSVSDAEKAQIKFNDARKQGVSDGNAVLEIEQKLIDENIKKMEQEIAVRKASGEDSKKLDKELKERKSKYLKEEIVRNQKIIDEGVATTKQLKKELDAQLADIELNFKKRDGSIKSGTGETEQAFQDRKRKRIRQVTEEFKEIAGKIEGYNKTRNQNISETNNQLLTIDEELAVNQAEITEKRLKELALLKRRLEDLKDQGIADDQEREIAETKTKFDREIKAITGNSKVESDLRKKLEETKLIEIEKIRQKYRIKNDKALKEAELFELTLIKNETDRLIALEKAKSEKVLKQIKESITLTEDEKVKFTAQEKERSNEAIAQIEVKAELKRLDNLRMIQEAKIIQKKADFETEEEFEKFKQEKLTEIQLETLKQQLSVLELYGESFEGQIEQMKAKIAELTTQFVDSDKDGFQKLGDEIEQVMVKAFDNIAKAQTKQVEHSKQLMQIQEKLVDDQRKRAQEGLKNTLAFEERERGKREAQIIKAEAKRARIQKISALYSSYANYSSQKEKFPGEAITKALKDFAILEAITATFGDGGVVEDKLPADGIFRGQSHRGSRGGIPIKVEGKEGIFSVKEMENLGKDNFYKMKDIAGMGKVDSNFFTNQRKAFVKVVPGGSMDPRLFSEMRSVKQAIENKPVPSLEAGRIINGVMEIIETTKTKNKTVRNTYKTKKPRL